jgi:hypothetical protein
VLAQPQVTSSADGDNRLEHGRLLVQMPHTPGQHQVRRALQISATGWMSHLMQ